MSGNPDKAADAVDKVAGETPEGRLLGNFRERRRLGITLRNMARVAYELKAADEWSEDRRTNAASIAAQLIDEKPTAFIKAGERDWASFLEAVISFIEAFMPLILIFMEMFGGI